MPTPAKPARRTQADLRPNGWALEAHLEDDTRQALARLRARLESHEERRPRSTPSQPAVEALAILPGPATVDATMAEAVQ